MIKINYVILGCMISCSVAAMDKDKDDKNQPLKSQQEVKVSSKDNTVEVLNQELERKRQLMMRQRREYQEKSDQVSGMYWRRMGYY